MMMSLVATNAQPHNYGANGVCTDAGCTNPYQVPTLLNGVFQLANAGNVEWFAAQVNKGGDNMFLNAVLTADIDMNGVTHTPIGNSEGAKFNGQFDGQGHRILNMIISTASSYQGFFGLLRGGGTVVKNLIIDRSCKISGGVRTGGIAGGAQTLVDASRPIQILNCGNEADITVPTNGGGGIMGASLSPHPVIHIVNCWNSGNIKGQKECAALTGWLGDNANSRIENCYNSGVVKGMDGTNRNLFRHANAPEAKNLYDVSETAGKTQGIKDGLSRDALSDGTLCFALNGNQQEIGWWQTLGTDAAPLPLAGHKQVFGSGTLRCDGLMLSGKTSFSNEKGSVTLLPHDFQKGYCTMCGAADPECVGAVRKVFLMGGQSNADGRAPVSTMPQYLRDCVTAGGSKYCYWSYCHGSEWSWQKFGGKLVPYLPFTDNNTTERCGFDAVVYHHIENALQERFYVVKESLGGTAIDTRCNTNSELWWYADPAWLATAAPRSGHSLTKEFLENIGLCLDAIKAKGEQPDIQCIMWHQGEADRSRGCDYAKNLRQLVEYLRAELVKITGEQKYATLPFVAGTVNRRSTQYNIAVEGALYKLEDELENFHVVDFSDCQLGSDVLHFDAVGNETCGARMFNKLVHLGLVEADTIAVSMPEPDSLRLAKRLITNYDFEFYETDNGAVANDGTTRCTGKAPFGWQHSWEGYPDMSYFGTSSPANFGIKGGVTAMNGKSCAFYTCRAAMPKDFCLWQTIPAGTLKAGTYRVSCRMGVNFLKAGVTRLFAGNNVQYFAPETRYDTIALATLFPEEHATFAGWKTNSTDDMKEMSVTVQVKEGEELTFGVRSSNVNTRGANTSIAQTGAFTTDLWRIVRIDDATAIETPRASSSSTPTAVYDLSGRRRERLPLHRGIYVVNGRKVVR